MSAARRPAARRGPRRGLGLTLLELMIALAIAAVLGAMAVPSMGTMLQHRRLSAAAWALATDLGEARAEAIRRGQTVQLLFGGDLSHWCYVLVAGGDDAAAPDCAARGAALGLRLLKRVTAADHPGIALLDAQPMRLGASGAAVALDAPSASLANARGEQLRVRLSRLGRPSLCAPAAAVGEVPRC